MVPTYILPSKDIRLLRKFQPDSFKAEKIVCVETDGQTDMDKNIYMRLYINVSFTAL